MNFRVMGIIMYSIAMVGCVATRPLQTRVYIVDHRYFVHSYLLNELNEQEVVDDEKEARNMIKFLGYAEISFPKGTFISIDRKNNQITMRNSPSELDRIEQLLKQMDGSNFYIDKKTIAP